MAVRPEAGDGNPGQGHSRTLVDRDRAAELDGAIGCGAAGAPPPEWRLSRRLEARGADRERTLRRRVDYRHDCRVEAILADASPGFHAEVAPSGHDRRVPDDRADPQEPPGPGAPGSNVLSRGHRLRGRQPDPPDIIAVGRDRAAGLGLDAHARD